MAWGDKCPDCLAQRLVRANRLARRIAFAATLLVGLYVAFRIPPLPLARFYGIVTVAVTYLAVRKIAQRVALELLPET